MTTRSFAIAAIALLSAALGPAQDNTEPIVPEHRALAKLAGEYSTLSRVRLKPDDGPIVVPGVSTLKSVLRGRWLAEEETSEQKGQPPVGLKYYGYNTTAQKYEGTWMFASSNSVVRLIGTSPDDGKTIRFTGSIYMAAGLTSTAEVTIKVTDADHFTVEQSWKHADGTPGLTMATTYSRKK